MQIHFLTNLAHLYIFALILVISIIAWSVYFVSSTVTNAITGAQEAQQLRQAVAMVDFDSERFVIIIKNIEDKKNLPKTIEWEKIKNIFAENKYVEPAASDNMPEEGTQIDEETPNDIGTIDILE